MAAMISGGKKFATKERDKRSHVLHENDEAAKMSVSMCPFLSKDDFRRSRHRSWTLVRL